MRTAGADGACGIVAAGRRQGARADATIADSFAAASFSFTTRIFISTLAYNRNDTTSQCNGAMNTPSGLQLVSTIVSGNTCSLGDDRDIRGLTTDVQGDHNLIGRANVPVPADTIAATDPRLAPLAENGGPTRTRLPLADGPGATAASKSRSGVMLRLRERGRCASHLDIRSTSLNRFSTRGRRAPCALENASGKPTQAAGRNRPSPANWRHQP
ncbi:hypothetical protein ACFPN1_13015 [Lysobacter yangpyeongensis]|uniref:Uncharacterized protein n=1 Tax=Lysobacter yangpyeongensis TaxID=346182 RepID=A0ABW0SQ33_9GAMM